jgi:hypothetical protein
VLNICDGSNPSPGSLWVLFTVCFPEVVMSCVPDLGGLSQPLSAEAVFLGAMLCGG